MENKTRKFDATVYLANYTKEHYDKITIIAPKGKKPELQAKAKARGLSTTQYILMAIDFFESHECGDNTNNE